MYENARKYNLTGTDAMVFEALVRLCKKTGAWHGTYAQLATYSLCGTRANAHIVVQRLMKRGLLSKDLTGSYKILTDLSNILKEKESTKEERNIKEKSSVSNDIAPHTLHTTFIDFWKLFSPNGEYKRYEKACKKIWEKTPEDWKVLAIQRAGEYLDRNPLYYLQDEDFLRLQAPSDPKVSAPQWLTSDEQYTLLNAGATLYFCERSTGGFGTVTKADMEKFGLKMVREIKL